jgi:hypothetical protein
VRSTLACSGSGLLSQQLIDAGACGELAEHRADNDACVANAGQAAHPIGVDGDSPLGHMARVLAVRPLPLPEKAAEGIRTLDLLHGN